MLKSPLRYPGGKAKAIAQIAQQLPPEFLEYREPFVGGGSVFIYLKQKYPHLKIWINDLNPELFRFWQVAQHNLDELVAEVRSIKKKTQNGKELFRELAKIQTAELNDLERAVRFFVLNRITFSGTIEAGGYSQGAFEKRFTDSSIDRLADLAPLLADIRITNLDYSEVLKAPGEQVFIFLDPPYYSATKSRLYGKAGTLHTGFEHQRFAQEIQHCQHSWLITYDDSPQIRENFHFAHLVPWQLQYGMNNYKQEKAAKGQELFILNYSNVSSNVQNLQQISLDLVY